jgi:hypothetical protein
MLPASAPADDRRGQRSRANSLVDTASLLGNRRFTALVARQPAADPTAPTTPVDPIADASSTLDDAIEAAAEPVVEAGTDLVGTAKANAMWGLVQLRINKPNTARPKKVDPGLTALADVLWSEDFKTLLGAVAKSAGAVATADAQAKAEREYERKKAKAEKRKKKPPRKPKPAVATKKAKAESVQRARAALLQRIYDGLAVGGGLSLSDIKAQEAFELTLLSASIKANLGAAKSTEDSWSLTRGALLATFGAFEVGVESAIERANRYYAQFVTAELCEVKGNIVHPELAKRLRLATEKLKKTVSSDEHERIKATLSKPGGFNIRPNQNALDRLSDHSFGWAVDLNASFNPNTSNQLLRLVPAITGHSPFKAVDPPAKGDNWTLGRTYGEVLKEATALAESSRRYTEAFADEKAVAKTILKLANASRATEKLAALTDLETGPLVATVMTPNIKAEKLIPLLFGATTVTKARTAAAQRLLDVYSIYKASFADGGGRLKASTPPSAGSLAAHGFFNLPPELVAALVADDGGGLRWLGSHAGTKDYMHFELREKPPLIVTGDSP